VLTAPVAAEGLEVDDVGTVVHMYADGKAFEVGLTTMDDKAVAVATVHAEIAPIAPTTSAIEEIRKANSVNLDAIRCEPERVRGRAASRMPAEHGPENARRSN